MFVSGIKHESASSETDPGYAPAAETKTDHVLIKAPEGYYLERGDGATSDVSQAHRFERGEAAKIIAEDRQWIPDVRIEEIPAAPKAAAPASSSPDDFVLIENHGEYWRAKGYGMTRDIAEAHRYSRRDAERLAKRAACLGIVEIAPASVDPLAARVAQLEARIVELVTRNIRLRILAAQLERRNADLLEDATSLIEAFVRKLAA